MTTLTHPADADVRPDVRTETHAHRHLSVELVKVLFLLVAFAVCAGGLFTIAWILGGAAYTTQAV